MVITVIAKCDSGNHHTFELCRQPLAPAGIEAVDVPHLTRGFGGDGDVEDDSSPSSSSLRMELVKLLT